MRPNVGKNMLSNQGDSLRLSQFSEVRSETRATDCAPSYQVNTIMICKFTTAAVKRLRLSSTRALSTRPEPQQTDSLLQIGSRRIYDSAHDGK